MFRYAVLLVAGLVLLLATGMWIDANYGPCAREDLRWPQHPSRVWMWR